MLYFLDNQNGVMMGAFPAPYSTVLTREEYIDLLQHDRARRPERLAELRAPKEETKTEEAATNG